MGAFLQGHQAGQAQLAHKQALEENRLRSLVLRHEIDRMKIEDQFRAREAAAENLRWLQGQPEADLPSDQVTTQQPNLPSRNLAGVITGLIQNRQGLGMDIGSPAPVSSSTPPGPITVPAPLAQDEAPGTHPVTTRVPRPVQIPGIDAFNGAPAVPGISRRPDSLEAVIRAQVAAKLQEPYTLAAGARRYVGGQEVARGLSRPLVVGAGATALNPDTGGVIARGGPRVAATPSPESLDLQRRRLKDAEARTAGAESDRRAAAAERQARVEEAADMRQWTADVSNGWKKHADELKVWTEKNKTAWRGEETDAPVYTPPTFEEWQAAHPRVAAKGPQVVATATLKNGTKWKVTKVYLDGSFDGDPVPVAAAGRPAAPAKEGDTKPIPGYPGTEQTFKNGKWIRTK